MEQKVNQFGYREELNRSMSGFSSFAISFSLISVLTGIFANFNFGYQQAGTLVIWTWVLVFSGQLLVAKVMSDLSVRFPIAGYGYQWAARLINADYGYFVGWMLLIQFITGFPGICQTFTITFLGITGMPLSNECITAGTVVVISLVSIIHLSGIRFASKVNDVGVFTELFGVALLIILLLVAWILSDMDKAKDISIVFNPLHSSSISISSIALSMLLGAWCLTGFEAAADLAEETKEPGRSVPRAVMFSLLVSAVCGLIIIGLFLLHAEHLAPTGKSPNILIDVLEHTVGHRFTVMILLFVLLSVFACAVAAMATASRLLFSLCRDKILPFSSWIGAVRQKSQTPANSIILIWAVSIFVILFFKRIEMITNVSALASYIGYAGIMLAVIMHNANASSNNRDQIHPWKRGIPVAAFLWTMAVIAALSIPETIIEGFQTRHLPAVSTGVGALFGVVLYVVYVRRQITKGKAGPPQIK